MNFCKTFLSVFLLLLSVGTIQAQLLINTVTRAGNADDEVIVDFIATSTTEGVAGMQFTINWTAAVWEFQELSGFSLDGLSENSFGPLMDNTRALSWINLGATGEVMNEERIFSMHFKVLSDEANELFFGSTPVLIEVIDGNLQHIALISETNAVVTDYTVLRGRVVADQNNDCTANEMEAGLAGWTISVTDSQSTRSAITQASGTYTMPLYAGDYEVTAIPPHGLWEACTEQTSLSVLNSLDPLPSIDFAGTAIVDCPLLEVSSSVSFLRECRENRYVVNYSNTGTVVAEAVYADIYFDTALSYVSSSLPATLQDDGSYRVALGDLEAGEKSNFDLRLFLQCLTPEEYDTNLALLNCVSIVLGPQPNCMVASPSWSGADLTLNTSCEDGRTRVTVSNIGEGDMTEPQELIVRSYRSSDPVPENGQNSFQINSGEQFELEFESGEHSYSSFFFEVEQVANHPFPGSMGLYSFCNIYEALDLVGALPTNLSTKPNYAFICSRAFALNSEFEIDTDGIIAAPSGYGEQNLIEPNTPIEYTVRFQNTTGEDVSNVVVSIPLSEHLDVNTVKPLVAGHPYSFDIIDGEVVRFTFPNMMLPSEKSNDSDSFGFISFRVNQLDNLASGTVIDFQASLQFDNNEVITTNPVFHTVGEDFLGDTSTSTQEAFQIPTLQAYPNPVHTQASFDLGSTPTEPTQFLLYDAMGRLVRTQTINTASFDVQRGDLTDGLYLFRIVAAEQSLYQGRIVVQ